MTRDIIQITSKDLALAKGVHMLERNEVPEPPDGAERDYGTPPYKNFGYVIDAPGPTRNSFMRWRFDKDGLMGFMTYKKNAMREAWYRGRGY